MKRRIFKLGLFLLLGAIINVAVAWGCQIHRVGALQWVLRSRVAVTDLVHHPIMATAPSAREAAIRIDIRLPIRAGWPLSAFEAFMFEYRDDRFVRTSGVWNAGIQVPARAFGMIGDCTTLPVRPIWPGFAINTIFYGGIVWLLFAAPFQFRRRRRIKRGLCPACAYPVGASDVCTECGKPVIAQPQRGDGM